jgi:hypothetical protein
MRASTVLLVVAACSISCGPGQPPEASAEQAVKSSVRSENPSLFELVSFKKTDGQSREIQGVHVYVLDFTATISLLGDTFYEATTDSIALSAPGPTLSDGRSLSWDAWLSTAVSGQKMAYQGDRLNVVGQVTFEKKESGWRVSAVAYRTILDPSARLADHGPSVPPGATIKTTAPAGKWSERFRLDDRPISCEEFDDNVIIQGVDETKSAVDGPTNRNWGPIVFGNNLRTIRFRAEGPKDVAVVCHVYAAGTTWRD